MLLGNNEALARLTHAEKQRVRDELAALCARMGISVHDPDSRDTPGEMVTTLEPTRHLQREHLRRIDQELRWVLDTPDAALMIWTPPQIGKALALDTPVFTAGGWSTIGRLHVGDTVYDRHGEPCRVTWKSPVWLDRDCYVVRTGDGEAITASAEHEWVARLDRRHGEQIHETTSLTRAHSKNVQITGPASLNLPERDLPLHPYVARIRRVWAEPTATVPTQCIEVDSPDHTYLAGRTLLPTHNSWRTSRAFPFWWLTHRPKDRILLGAYALSLARSHALATRTLIENYGAQFGLLPDRTEWTSTDFTLLSDGGVRVRGVGGGLTGHPGHLGLIDDPYASRQAADSPVIREGVWDWYSSVFTARLAPNARQVITMTRWHPKDLCGQLLERDGRIEDGGRWKVLHMPAIAVPPDPERGFGPDALERAPGQPLSHPAIAEGDTTALLAHWANQKARSTIRDWDSMYQGSPYRSEGATLTEAEVRERTAQPPVAPSGSKHSAFRRTGVGVDPSGGGRDTAGLIAGGVDHNRKLWWTHDWSAVMSAGEWADRACMLAAMVDADCFVVETNYGGDQATTLLRRAWATLLAEKKLIGPDKQPLRDNAPCPRLISVHSRKSKILRAEPIAQAVKLGAAWFAAGPHLLGFKREWTLWEPDSTWSPGALDAGVHLAYELLPPPASNAGVHSVAARSRSTNREGAVAARRVSR